MRKFHGAGRLAVGLALAGASLCGCADVRRAVSLPPVNAESPVAAQVRAAAPRRYDTPRLADVPPIPRNVPDAPTVKTGVLGMVLCRRSVASFPLTHPPLSAGAEAFASDAREVAQINPADVPAPNSAALSGEEADRLRAYAAPPPALASGPAPTADQAKPGGPAPSDAPASSRAPRTAAASSPPPSPAAAPAGTGGVAGQAPALAADPASGVPPLPAPRADPLLGRCS